mmetsp:Transcript_16137/g.47957  ORF Transcript_16137/g.47957 Transcript_16137/m.47957 type:complete len:204 (+) Transcript_16137:800-1411(+)
MANFLTASLNVALKSSSCMAVFFLRMLRMRRTESSAKPSALSISSASSNTRIAIESSDRMRLLAHALSLPCAPITTCSLMGSLRKPEPSAPSVAVDVARIPVNFPMRLSTLRFWTTSSRVGHMHSACGWLSFGSTLLSMDSTKHVVFPDPLCACAMRSLYGGDKIIGSVMLCTLDGRSNFISTYSPLRMSALSGSSSKETAEE